MLSLSLGGGEHEAAQGSFTFFGKGEAVAQAARGRSEQAARAFRTIGLAQAPTSSDTESRQE